MLLVDARSRIGSIPLVLLICTLLLMYNSINIDWNMNMDLCWSAFKASELTHSMSILVIICGILVSVNKVSWELKMIKNFTILGICLLIMCNDLISIFLALELQSLSLYIMATLNKTSQSSVSSGMKYLLIGSGSSSIILLGSVLIYNNTGLTNLEQIWSLQSVTPISGVTIGITLMLLGILLKVGSVPFHNWAVDVYDGVPTIITSWIGVVPKISLLILMSKLILSKVIIVGSVMTLILSSIIGLSQYKMKRLMIYSGISHIGFMLLGLGINTGLGLTSWLFYLIQYTLSGLCIFLILVSVGERLTFISSLSGIRNIGLGMTLTLCMFSMAGVPPLIGFYGKLGILDSALVNGNYIMAIIGIISSAISAAYYLKVVKTINFDKADSSWALSIGKNESVVISILTGLIVLFVIKPKPLLNSAQLLSLSGYIQ